MDKNQIPAWAVPAKAQAPVTPPADVPQAPPAKGGGNFVSNAVSSVKNFVGGLFGGNKTNATPTDTTQQIPDWAVPKKAAPKPTPATHPAPTADEQKAGAPSWAVSASQKKNEPPDLSGNNPFGNLNKTDTSLEGGTKSSISETLDQYGKAPSIIPSPGDTYQPNPAIPPSPSDWANGAVETAKGLAQAFPRTAAGIGVLLGQTGQVISNKFMGVDTAPLKGTDVADNMKWLLGDGTVNSPAQEIDTVTQSIKNSPLAQKIGLDKFAPQLGFAGVLGNDFLTFDGLDAPGENGFGLKGRLAAIDLLSKVNTVEDVMPILDQMGMHADISSDLAPHFAEMTDKKEISDALDLAENLQKARSALPEATDMNDHASGDPYRQSYNGSAIEAAQSHIKTAYAAVAPEAIDQAAGEVMAQLELSTAGSRLITGTGPDRTVTGISSTFPEWVPENLRSKDLFNKVLGYIDPSDPKFGTFPPGNRPKQRALVYELYNTLDNKLGVDTQSFRNDIINEYQAYDENKIETANTSTGSSTGGEINADEVGAAFGGEPISGGENTGNEVGTSIGGGVDTMAQSMGGTDTNVGTNGQPATVIHPGDTPPEQPQDTTPMPSSAEVRAQIPEAMAAETARMQSIKDLMRGRIETAKAENKAVQEEVDATQPVVAASENDQRSANMNAYHGDVTAGPFKGWDSDNVKAFQTFVNRRKMDTLQAVGAVVRMRFEGLRSGGVDDILKFEGYERDEAGNIVALESGPDRSGLLGTIHGAYEEFFAAAKEAGVELNHRDNYLPIMIKDPRTGDIFIDGVPLGGRQVGRKPGFALPREFKTNAEALQAGYQLVYPNHPDLIQQYAMNVERAIANSEFFNHLTSTGNAVPSSLTKETDGPKFTSFDPDRFPTKTVRFEDKVYSGTFKGPEPIVKKVNQYLAEPNTFLKKTARGFGAIKNVALSIGIPKTGFSVHYWNLLPREVLADMAINPLSAPKEIAKFLYYGLNTSAARDYIDHNLEKALPFMRAGLTLSSEEHNLESLGRVFEKSKDGTYVEKAGSVGKWVGEFLHNAFAKGTFSRVIPARKLFQAQRFFDFGVKNGMSEDEAYKWASVQVNSLYGGINWEQLGRSKDWQNGMRSILMAPDYAESNINLGANMAKSFGRLFKTPTAEKEATDEAIKAGQVSGKLYRNMAYAMVALYVTADMVNYENNGKHLYQNDPLHQLSIATGKDTQGRTRYINAFGTGFDFVRIPLQIATSIAQGKYNDLFAILRNRLAIPVGATVGLLTNTDWAGQKIWGSDIFGNPQSTSKQMQNFFNSTIGTMAPSSFTSIESAVTGKTSPEQAAIQGLALPVGYVNEKPNATTIKQLEADAKTAIASGDYTLYNDLVKAKIISPRSRAAFIRSALTGAKSARQVRTSAKAKAKLQAEEASLETEGYNKNSQ